MSVVAPPLGQPLGEALAAAHPAAAQQLQQLATPGADAAATAAALSAKAGEAQAAGATEAAVTGATADIGKAFSSATPVETPAVPCACGAHVAPAFDRAAAQQHIVDGVGSGIKSNPLRQEYEGKVAALSSYSDQIPGKNLEQLAALAEQANQARRALGVQYKNLTPAPLLDYIKDVNVARYGDPLGPTVDRLVDDGKTYTQIIQGAARPNPDVDKLLAGFGDWLSKKPDDYVRQCLPLIGK